MNPTNNTQLLDGICRRGVLVSTSVRYWRGCKRLNPGDLGLDPAHVSDRLIQLGHKRLIPRDALSAFALIESRVQATVESSSFPFLGGIGRFVPNPRLGDLTDKLDKLHDEFREATLDFVAGYTPLREARASRPCVMKPPGLPARSSPPSTARKTVSTSARSTASPRSSTASAR